MRYADVVRDASPPRFLCDRDTQRDMPSRGRDPIVYDENEELEVESVIYNNPLSLQLVQ